MGGFYFTYFEIVLLDDEIFSLRILLILQSDEEELVTFSCLRD
jgi:hypothetical protein